MSISEKKTYKPIPFYFITTTDKEDLSPEKTYEALKGMKECGFGGAVLFNKPPHGFDAEGYLSDDWFEAIGNFIKAAEKLELEIWINDGFNFPPGSAAGRVQKADSTLAQMHIKRENGKIVTEEVDWGYPAFEYARSSELFIEIVYEEYYKRFKQYFGNVLRGFFSDADNRRVHAAVFRPNSPQMNYFPWSRDFEAQFSEAYGYQIMDHIDEVLDRQDTQAAADYWALCSQLYAQWFKGNYEWCKAHGVEYTFHSGDTSPFDYATAPRSSVFTEGRFLDMEVNSDYPGTDQELLELNGGKHYIKEQLYMPKVSWGNTEGCRKSPEYYDLYKDVRTKQSQSCAFLNDKKGAMCEMFAATDWGASYEELREVAAFQIMQGITFIVTHAYHHKLWGNTKYFAPPEFSTRGYMQYVEAFNDTLTRYVTLADQGTLRAPIAVLDITEDLWRERGGSELFLKLCNRLNRVPFGYIITDIKSLEKKKDAFSLILNTSSEKYDELFGIKVVNITDADQLDEAIKDLIPDITYEGEGTPHYMVRETDQGLCALIANIENDHELIGKVTFDGCTYDISLYPGEIAFFSEKENIYRAPRKVKASLPLPALCPVEWEKENMLPLDRWLSETGEVVLLSEEHDKVHFEFTVVSPVEDLKLYIPAVCQDSIKGIDGVDLDSAKEAQVLDDIYVCYNLPAKEGLNVITLEKTAPIKFQNRIFIGGEFDVEVKAENGLYKRNFVLYNLTSYVPEKATVVLGTRSKVLDTYKSAALQGHPFYFGGVTYHMEAEVPETFGDYEIYVHNAMNGVSVKVDDGEYLDLLFRPFTVSCNKTGKIHLSIKTYATLANFLELYPREFGILEGVSLDVLE